MKTIIKKYPVSSFFLTAIFISWAGWIPYAANKAGLLSKNIPSEIIWIAEFGPTLSAIFIVFVLNGKKGLRNLINKLLNWKVNIKWYLFSILIIPMLILLSIGFGSLFFNEIYDFALLTEWDKNFIQRTEAFTPSIGIISALVTLMKSGTVATALIFLLLAITNGGISEEIGWRGFVLQKYQNRRYSLLVASVLVALLWALWHTGTIFWQTIMTTSLAKGLEFAITYLFQYLLLVIPLSIIYTVVYNGTNGSVLLSVILHACYNISISVFASALPNFPMITLVCILWVFALILILLTWNHKKYNKKYGNEKNRMCEKTSSAQIVAFNGKE